MFHLKFGFTHQLLSVLNKLYQIQLHSSRSEKSFWFFTDTLFQIRYVWFPRCLCVFISLNGIQKIQVHKERLRHFLFLGVWRSSNMVMCWLGNKIFTPIFRLEFHSLWNLLVIIQKFFTRAGAEPYSSIWWKNELFFITIIRVINLFLYYFTTTSEFYKLHSFSHFSSHNAFLGISLSSSS